MYKDILLAVDLSDENSWSKALPTAVEYCKAFGSRLHVITVVPEFGMVRQYFPNDYGQKLKDSVSKELHAFTKRHVPEDCPVQHIVAHGTIYEEILKAAGTVGADLIVVSSHRPELEDFLLGTNAARVVRHAKTSVLVVR